MSLNDLIKPVENAVDILGRTTLGRLGIKSGAVELRHGILPAPKPDPSFYVESESNCDGLAGTDFSLENTMVTLENDAAAKSHYVKIWDMSLCRPVKLVKAHDQAIYNIIKSNDMKYFATVSLDRTARLFDIRGGELLRTFEYEHVPCRVTISDDSRLIIVSDVMGRVVVKDAGTGELVRTIETGVVPYSLSISKDNRFILIAREDNCHVYDLHAAKLVRSFELIRNSPSERVKTSGSHVIISGGRHCYVECDGSRAFVRDLFSGSAVEVFDHGAPVTHAYVNTRNNLMSLTSEDYVSSVWDLRTMTFVGRIAHADFLNVYITSHEKFLITINEKIKPEYGIGLFDVRTGELLADIYCAFESGYKFCVTTGPDEVSKNGWISTNVPEIIEVSEFDRDGNRAAKLTPDDPRRLDYIRSINRGDIVAARLNDRDEYERLIGEIKYGALENRINDRKKVMGLLENQG